MVRLLIQLAGCDVFKVISSRFLRSTAHTWVARSAGSHNPDYSCVPVTAARTTGTARARQDRRSAGSSNIPTRLRTAFSLSRRGSCPHREHRLLHLPRRSRHAPDYKDWRMVRPSLAASCGDTRRDRKSVVEGKRGEKGERHSLGGQMR